MRCAAKAFLILFLVACSLNAVLGAQQACQPPRLDLSQSGPDIFSSQQEQQLGEIMAQWLSIPRISNDPVVTAYLEKVGERLARHLPPAGFPVRYFLVESSWPDAFTLPGGRIYITRGLIVQLRNPDELAAILGHEMGHMVTHQSAIDTTFLLEKVLGVTRVTDREDIQRKVDDLEADWRHNRAAFRQVARRNGPDQRIADKTALYAVAAAGFSPEVYPEVFKRIAFSGGTGTWLSDFFHTTTPDQIRLRALLKAVEAMPRNCIGQRSQADPSGFQRWRKTVLDFAGWGKRREALHGVVARVRLEPLSLGELEYVRFSPDGRYLLAQRKKSIYVFSRSPFAFLFRIYAPDAQRPRFTANSRSVAFTGVGSRVQVWDLASQKRVLSYTPQLPAECAKSLLSPDASVLACLRVDGTLDLIQLPSGKIIFERRGFTRRAHRGRWGLVLPDAHLSFSPDSHYFLTHADFKTVALDLRTSKAIKLPRSLRGQLRNGFTFLSDGRLLVLRPTMQPSSILMMDNSLLPFPGYRVYMDSTGSENLSVLFEFPSGKLVGRVRAGVGANVQPATDADYLLIGLVQPYQLGIFNLATGKIEVALDQPSADVYKGAYAHQRTGGGLGLYNLKTRLLQSGAELPPGDEKKFWTLIASPDLKWLATPAGAIWDLSSGKMVFHLRKFYNGVFDGEKAIVAYFPRYQNRPGTLARIDLIKKEIEPQPANKNDRAYRQGAYLVLPEPHQTKAIQGVFNPCRWKYPDFDPMDCDVTYEVRDARSGKKLWDRRFPKEVPNFRMEPERRRVVIDWPASVAAVGDEIKQFPQLASKWETARKQPEENFVEILDSSNGSLRHAMFVNGGIQRDFLTAGQHLLAVHDGYIEIYSLATAAREGEIPGYPSAVSPTGGLLAVVGSAPNILNIYGLQSRLRIDQFAFPADIDLAQFGRDGKRLLVVTRAETAYILDMRTYQKTPFANP